VKILFYLSNNQWTSVLNNHPNSNIFQSPVMYSVYQETKNYEPVFLAVKDEQENILGVLLAVLQKEHSGFLGKFSSRSIIWGGPIIKDNDPVILDYILKEYNKIIKKKAIYTQFRNLWDWKEQKEIFANNGFDHEDHLDILFDLKKTEDGLWKEMKRSCKKNIKKSYKNDIKILELDLNDSKIFNESYEILRDVYLRIKLPFPTKSLFRNAVKFLYSKKYLHAKGAFLENKLIGVRLVLCYKNLIYDWFAGAKDGFLSYRPNDVLPWEIMKWGVNNGYEVFDFGGAGKPNIPYGVRDYKLKFGGKLVNWGRFEKIHKTRLYKFVKVVFILWKKK
jgi:serine/alanine adding enzyme